MPVAQDDPDALLGETAIERQFADAEKKGLQLALMGRTAALAPIALWYGGAGAMKFDVAGAGAVLLFIGLGLLHFFLIRTGRERPWYRYVFVGLDAVGLALIVALVPLSTGGNVPQIIVFRSYNTGYLYLLLAFATLSLSPRLVLFAGVAATAAIWSAFLYIVAGMERTVSWGDMPRGPDAQSYLRIFLDPDFIGTGNRIEESMGLILTACLLALAVRRARDLVRARANAEAQRWRIQQVFGQYVPPEAANLILSNESALAPQLRTASVLFCDIQGFTTLSERRHPADVIASLNNFFDAGTKLVTAHGGVVVSLVGDAIIAVFNAPLDLDDHAVKAIRCGEAILDMASYGTFLGQRLTLRIGIASGEIAAGSVGGSVRQTWTIYGDTVNLAQRLEALNKELGTSILIDETTQELAQRQLPLVFRTTVTARGRTQETRVFTIGQNGKTSAYSTPAD